MLLPLLLMTLHAAGLRCAELTRLKISDVDSKLIPHLLERTKT